MKPLPKVALITGAARRIGAEIAAILHENGFNVVLHYRNSAQDAENLAAKLNEERPSSAICLRFDLMDIENLAHFVSEANNQWGRLDVLVNNASDFYKTPLLKVTEENWDDLLTINLKAPFFLAQHAIPFLRAAHGSIINITDIHGERPMKEYSAYCISKAGLIMATRVLAKELGPDIRVNAVSPGAILWPEGGNELNDHEKQKILSRVPLQRPGEANEIAKAVLFLAKDASYVSGQILAVDGGRSVFI